jgi:hypothetical protein
VVVDPSLIVELGPDGLGEADVEGMVPMQVSDLPAAELERPLAPIALAGLDAG